MVQPAAEVVRLWTSRMMAGDLAVEMFDEEARMENSPSFPIQGPYLGHAGIRRWWEELRSTRIDIETLWASIFWVRDGLIARTEGYGSRRQALRALDAPRPGGSV